jgi:3-dehydroquinate synthase
MSDSVQLSVPSATGPYPVEIGVGLLAQVGARLLAGPHALLGNAATRRVFVVTSPEIWRLWGERLSSGFPAPLTVLSVPAGEQHKRLSTVERLLEELAQAGADRDSLLLAFGGGVIGDITGFLAATYMRGLRYVQVPTTALAQIDSSVGGKTGVNLAAGKNLVGAFYNPAAIYADIAVLATLPPAELCAGLQEAVKAGILRDAALFAFLESQSEAVLSGDPAALLRVIADSVRVKAEVVAADEHEAGLRMILNLGHTLGHALEAATHYTALLHGEAVAWGMIAAVGIARNRRLVSAEEAARMDRTIRRYGPLKPFAADAQTLVDLTAKDKKNRGGARSFVLPVGIGRATIVQDVSAAELREAARLIVAEAASLQVPA